MNEHEAIIRELAEDGPFLDRSASLRAEVCMTCEMTEESEGEDLRDPKYHEPECLWRRALTVDPVCSSVAKAKA